MAWALLFVMIMAAQAPSAKDARTLAATSLLIEVVDFLGASRTDWSSMLLYWAMLPWLACVARASRPPRAGVKRRFEIYSRELRRRRV